MKKIALFTLLPLLLCLRAGDALAAPFAWELTPRTQVWHSGLHAAVLLDDGTVLVTGGRTDVSCSTCLSDETEVYNLARNEWSTVAKLGTARRSHTATKLRDGRVLVTGGADEVDNSDDSNPTHLAASTEVYDPVARSWAAVTPMSTPRIGHSATRLADGRVLVAGGAADPIYTGVLASAEVYDPATDAWLPVAAMGPPRVGHEATLLHDGRVLVTGGHLDDHDGPATNTAQIYDPAADTWTMVAPMHLERLAHSAIELADHRVLVAGGSSDIAGKEKLSGAEIFDPTAGTWTETTPMSPARTSHSAVLLPSGHVLVSGGYSTISNSSSNANAVLYDAAQGTWLPFPSTLAAHLYHAVTLLGSDAVLLVGGPTWSTNAEVLRLRRPGEACEAAFECGSGFCVEGLCCDLACDGCATCTAASGAVADGTCTALGCGAYTCDAGERARVCLTECTTSEDCAAGHACEPGSHTCVRPRSTFVTEACAFAPPDLPVRGPLALLFATALAVLARRTASRRRFRRITALLAALLAGLAAAGCAEDDVSLCGPGLTLCGDQCTDVATDPESCGACDNVCSAEELCLGGRCALGCSGGTRQCGTRCVDPGVDPDNCGECGAACAPGQICSAGRCELPGSLTSYIFTGGSAAGGSRARDVSLALAAEAPALIYYTTDGSTPVPGAPGTQVGASPVTLPPTLGNSVFSSKLIQWFADYATLGREATVHTYFAAADPEIQGELGHLTEDLVLDGAGGPVITVPAGATVSGEATYQLWRSKKGIGTCPDCIIQYVLEVDGANGVDGAGIVACLNSNQPGVYPIEVYPGRTGKIAFSFQAPASPGRYFVRHGNALENSCKGLKVGKLSDEEVGLVIVY